MSDSVKAYFTKYPGDIKVDIDKPKYIYESPDGGKTVRKRPIHEPKQDRFVQQVKNKYEQRSQTGIAKYGTTLEREDVDLQGWLTHLQEELMDATLYVEKLLHETTNNSKAGSEDGDS